MDQSLIQQIQTLLGVRPDGVWGPVSQEALNTTIASTDGNGNPLLAEIQTLLKVPADGFWGPVSQNALNAARDGNSGSGFRAVASSFADPADVRAFKECKSTGRSDLICFRVGDNGIGAFGMVTAQDDIPMVALTRSDMVTRWGSVQGAAHRPVIVTVNGRTIRATVEDILGVEGRIDLNPAAARELGLNPPFLERDCTWNWA